LNHELDDDQCDEVGEGLAEVETADGRVAGIGGTPEDENHHEVEKRKKATDGEVRPVDQVALQADGKGGVVFGQGGEHFRGQKSEDRSQGTEVRGQRTEEGRQRTEIRERGAGNGERAKSQEGG